jgi:hypothetical protein
LPGWGRCKYFRLPFSSKTTRDPSPSRTSPPRATNQCLDVREHGSSTGRHREDGFERAAVFCLHCLNDSMKCYHTAIFGFLNSNSVIEGPGRVKFALPPATGLDALAARFKKRGYSFPVLPPKFTLSASKARISSVFD